MHCALCGSEVPAGSRFCGSCGNAVPVESGPPPAFEAAPDVPDKPAASGTLDPQQDADAVAMEWVATLSILRNKVVLAQLGLVFAIPLLVLSVILAVILRPAGPDDWRFLAGIVLVGGGVYLALLAVGVLVVYGGRYEYEFRMNDEGIGGRPHGRTATKNRVVNALLPLSGNATAAGAGMLAQARQVEYVAWKDVDAIGSDRRHRTITILKGRWPRMVVACNEDNHAAVEAYARSAIERASSRRRRRRAG